MFFPSEDFTEIKNTITLTPRPARCDARFLYYVLSQVSLPQRGAGQPFISKGDIERFIVSVPHNIREQKRLARILDEANDGIAAAKTLTELNINNARLVLEAELSSIFGGSNTSWQTAPLGKHVTFIDYRGRTPRKTSSGIKLITAKNIRMGYVRDTPAEFIDPAEYDSWMTRGIPAFGDVLFTTEAPLANVAQLTTHERVVFAQRVIIMHADAAYIDGTFLKYALMSAPVQRLIQEQSTGATATGIKARLLKQIPIAFPRKLAEQASTAFRLEKLTKQCELLSRAFEGKSALLAELSLATLNAAFNGGF